MPLGGPKKLGGYSGDSYTLRGAFHWAALTLILLSFHHSLLLGLFGFSEPAFGSLCCGDRWKERGDGRERRKEGGGQTAREQD